MTLMIKPDVDVHRVNLWEATWSQTEVRVNNGLKGVKYVRAIQISTN